MSRRLYTLVVLLVVSSIGAALVFGLHGSGSAAACKASPIGTTHRIVISGGKVVPAQTVRAVLCDRLTIVNEDAEAREIAFGPHEEHAPYDGVAEKVLSQGQALTIVFDQAGTYHWHDHVHDEVGGYFTVTK